MNQVSKVHGFSLRSIACTNPYTCAKQAIVSEAAKFEVTILRESEIEYYQGKGSEIAWPNIELTIRQETIQVHVLLYINGVVLYKGIAEAPGYSGEEMDDFEMRFGHGVTV